MIISWKHTYEDFNGDERTEEFYFNLSEAELLEMNMAEYGGLDAKIRRAINGNDSKMIFVMFKDIIRRSYGVKSEDGRKFVKNQAVFEDFTQTPAYSDLFVELMDEQKAAQFINGILPKKLKSKIENNTPAGIPKEG